MKRIQRQRTRGWRMPPDAIYVGRPSQWGNPWRAGAKDAVWWAVAIGEKGNKAGRHAGAVAWFRWLLTGDLNRLPIKLCGDDGQGDIEYASGRTAHIADLPAGLALMMLTKDGAVQLPARPADMAVWLEPLAGRDLACWCSLSEPCHADILLELASPTPSDTGMGRT